MIGKPSQYPSEIIRLRNRFEEWRKKKRQSDPIPMPLWTSAASLAKKYGLSKVATALRLNHYSLKKRVEVAGTKKPDTPRPLFVELNQPVLVPECLLELGNPRGDTVKVHLKGPSNLDLVALGNALWRSQP